MIGVRTGEGQCFAKNTGCNKEAAISVSIEGDMRIDASDQIDFELCIPCAKSLFNAVGFMIMSKTGESLERLVGLKKRRDDKR